MDRRHLLIFPYTLWLLLLIVAPFSLIFATSFAERSSLGEIHFAFSLEAFRQLADPVYATILGRTALLALLHSAITLCISYPMAFFLSRISKEESSLFLTLLMVPFWTNYLIRLLAFMDVLRLNLFGLEWTYTQSGMLAALLYNYLPFAILPLYSAMEKIPNSLLEAAQDLGASKRRVFSTVLWPLTKQSVVATFLLIFIPSLGEFLIPVVVGGGQSYYLGNFLQQQFLVSRNWPLGSAAIAILLLISVVLLRLGGAGLLEKEKA